MISNQTAIDTKRFRKIVSREDVLQSDIRLLETWSQKWRLNFHPDKCHVLTLGRFENIMHTQRYNICGHEMEHVFEEKDLGVIGDSDLTFEEHIIQNKNSKCDCCSSRCIYTLRQHLYIALIDFGVLSYILFAIRLSTFQHVTSE